MAVMTPRENWTDERLDDFRGEVNRRFDEVYRRFDEVDQRLDKVDQRLDRMDQRLDKMDQRLEETNRRMDAGFERIVDRFEGLHRMLFQAAVALIVGMLGLVGLLIGLVV